MMTFQQACAYVRATGASAYCYTPWFREGEWIGLQHCTLYEPGTAPVLGMRIRRLARGARENEVVEVPRLDIWELMSSPQLEAEYGTDPRTYRYAPADEEADEGSVLQALGGEVSAEPAGVPGWVRRAAALEGPSR